MKSFSLVFLLIVFTFVNGRTQSSIAYPTEIVSDIHHDTSPPLCELQMLPPGEKISRWKNGEIPNQLFPLNLSEHSTSEIRIFPEDPVIQDDMGLDQAISTILNYDGISGNGTNAPPDPVGDIGFTHYIQAVNTSFAVYGKSGNLVYGPASLATLWQGFPGGYTTDGDPIVLFDHLAGRWVMSQFSLPNYPNGPFYELVAISQSEDPLGSWHRYAFQFSRMPDYPKFGVWPNGYYFSAKSYTSGALNWAGPLVAVLERDSMLVGGNARLVSFQQDISLKQMLPADLDGPGAPAGAPGIFMMVSDDAMGDTTDHLMIYHLAPDWNNIANTSFSGPLVLNTSAFDLSLCSDGISCIPQKGTGQRLDALSNMIMHRLQYRNFENHESMVVNHTVEAGYNNHACIRWYELRRTNGNWYIYQQGTYAPDSLHRWNGSIAMDGDGNIALGYSLSGNTLFPSIAVTGQRPGDPYGHMSMLEEMIIEGTGAQKGISRWGDYSSLSVDPSDDATFWYTNEYYQISSYMTWASRIASFTINNLQVSTEEKPAARSKYYQLHKIYPNPSPGNFTLRWELHKPMFVRIMFFDISGKLIDTFFDARQNAGEHSLQITAQHLKNGVYFCQFMIGDDTDIQRLVMLR